MAQDVTYRDGSDLMVFLGGKPMLAAKSHKIAYKTTTKTITTKDTTNSKYKRKIVTGIDVTITADALSVVESAPTAVGYTELLAELKKGTSVELKFGLKDKTGSYESGKFVVDSLDLNTPAGEESSYSAQFSNDGEVKTVTSFDGK